MDFTNNASLFDAINDDVALIVRQVSEEYLEIMKENVDKIVYEPYKPALYNRRHTPSIHSKDFFLEYNGDSFYDSWVSEGYYDELGNPYNVIYSDPQIMAYEPDSYIHGNPKVDRRDEMDENIAEGKNFDFMVEEFTEDKDGNTVENPAYAESNWWTKPRDYFTPTVDEIKNSIDKSVWRKLIRMKIQIG